MFSLKEMTAELVSGIDDIPDDVRHSGPQQPEEVEIFFEAAHGNNPEIGWTLTGDVSDDDRCVSRIGVCGTYHEFSDFLQSRSWEHQLNEIADDILHRQATGHY